MGEDLLTLAMHGAGAMPGLNRPAKRNAISDTLLGALAQTAPEAQARLAAFLEKRAPKAGGS